MSLTLVLVAMGLLVAGAVAAALCGRHDRAALAVGTTSAALASLIGAGASLAALLGSQGASATALRIPAPLGRLEVGIDALSAFFLLCVFTVSGLAAVYGAGYLLPHAKEQRLAPAVALFDLLVAAMVGVVIARDGVVFLMAWEIMSISSFFLVTFDSDHEDVRRAGLTYLVASHAGVVLALLFFVLLARKAGSFGFDAFVAAGLREHGGKGALFLLALVGFGAKAGFWPLHVWLPDAHPAAPSHVSALMSGVMIKMGIYGLLRALTFLGPPPAWWGAVLVGVGAVSGVAGVLHALAQHDLKRLLAYHSVENIGIIALGIGLGVLGQAEGQPAIAFLGYAGGLLHVLNHGLFKGLLFQGAGSVLHATGTRDIDSLGGLARRMPVTALCFLVGSVAICGLPPLNGFVSEWLVYVAAFRSGHGLGAGWAIAGLFAAPALALIGGLAAACFVKAYGVVFLGEPRTPAAEGGHEQGLLMRAPMLIGAALCAVIGLAGPWAVRLVAAPAVELAAIAFADGGAPVGHPVAFPPQAPGTRPDLPPPHTPPIAPEGVVETLASVTRVAAVLVALVVGLALLRTALLRGRDVRASATWGCGYARPTARMQYTAASFAEPLLAPFALVFRRETHAHPPEGTFPTAARDDEHLDDRADGILRRAVRGFHDLLGRMLILQHGRIPLYLAYVLATLVTLLAWLAATSGQG